MPSLMIHLLIGEEYCKKNNVLDKMQFLVGVLAPDMYSPKSTTHFSRKTNNKTYTEDIKNYINLKAFCKNTDINSDYNRGMFMHLLTDEYFFNRYLLNNHKYKAIEHLNMLEIERILYEDYDKLNTWIHKFHPQLKTYLLPQQLTLPKDGTLELLSVEDIQKIIDYCSSFDLDNLYKTISQNKDNYNIFNWDKILTTIFVVNI